MRKQNGVRSGPPLDRTFFCPHPCAFRVLSPNDKLGAYTRPKCLGARTYCPSSAHYSGEVIITSPTDYDEDGVDDDLNTEIDGDTLVAVQTVVRIVASLDWFSAIGTPLLASIRTDAEIYLNALGFSDLSVAPLPDWREAKAALDERAWESTWSDAEDQARSALAAQALDINGEDVVSAAVGYVSERAHDAATNSLNACAALLGADSELIEAAAYDARDAACQALLIALSDEGIDHPLALKFRLFEAGRWPLGAVGSSFNLF